LESPFDGFLSVSCFRDDVQVWFGAEEELQSFANNLVVVGDEDAGDGGDGQG
jgi:hypothetical protein